MYELLTVKYHFLHRTLPACASIIGSYVFRQIKGFNLMVRTNNKYTNVTFTAYGNFDYLRTIQSMNSILRHI